MGDTVFGRGAQALIGRAPRRQTVRALTGSGLAFVAARLGINGSDARKKRCRKPGQTCGGHKKCCKKGGDAVCQQFPSSLCRGVDRTGRRCCGLEGAFCDPNFGTPIDVSPISGGNCSCCDLLYCGKQPDGRYRCQTEDT